MVFLPLHMTDGRSGANQEYGVFGSTSPTLRTYQSTEAQPESEPQASMDVAALVDARSQINRGPVDRMIDTSDGLSGSLKRSNCLSNQPDRRSLLGSLETQVHDCQTKVGRIMKSSRTVCIENYLLSQHTSWHVRLSTSTSTSSM